MGTDILGVLLTAILLGRQRVLRRFEFARSRRAGDRLEALAAERRAR